jgi:hypothetical protein
MATLSFTDLVTDAKVECGAILSRWHVASFVRGEVLQILEPHSKYVATPPLRPFSGAVRTASSLIAADPRAPPSRTHSPVRMPRGYRATTNISVIGGVAVDTTTTRRHRRRCGRGGSGACAVRLSI